MSVIANSGGLLPPRVEPKSESLRAAISERIKPLQRRNERIKIELGLSANIIIDMATGTVCDEISSDASSCVTLTLDARQLSRIMNGVVEPRNGLLYGWMTFKGQLESGIRLCDELAGNRFPRQENFSDHALPEPTKDWDLARHQLRDYGYCIVKDAISQEQLQALRIRLDDQAAAELEAGIAFLDGGRGASKERRGNRGDDELSDEASSDVIAPSQRVWLLHNKGKAFLDLMENPIFEEIVADYLDEDHPLAAIYSANNVGPGAEAQFLHQDQSGVKPTPPFAIGVNTLLCLDDFTEDNGATRIIPGSHIKERGLAPDNIYTSKGTVAAVAPAGSAIIFESRLWHGSGASKPGQKSRRSITLLTQRAWTRGSTNGVLAVHPEVLETMSDDLKSRMGFRVTDGLGAIQTEPEGTIIGWNPDQLMRELSPQANAD